MILLITGHQRSGTTLLRRLCDVHPQMRVTNEFGCFMDGGQVYGRVIRNRLAHWRLVNGRWAYDSVNANSSHKHRRNLQFTLAYLWRLAEHGRGMVSILAVIQTMQKMFTDVPIVGDKLPQYMPILPRLVMYEEMKPVVIYRDCRDVTSSFLKMVRTVWQERPWAEDVNTAVKIAHNWVNQIEQMERLAPHIHIVRYEELVAEPQRVLATLGEWLGVDPIGFKPQMVKATSIGRHFQGLTLTELDDVLSVAGETMTRLGYD